MYRTPITDHNNPVPSEIVLNTSTRNSGTTNRPVWSINATHHINHRDVDLALKQINFFNAVYPINEYNNHIVANIDGSGSTDYYLTPASYSGDTFATALTNLLTVGTTSVTVTYDSSTGKLTFVLNAGSLTFDETTNNSMYPAMGLDPSTQLGAVTGTLVGANPVNIAGTNVIVINSNYTAGENYNSRGNGTPLATIPVYANFGQLVSYTVPEIHWTRVSTTGLALFELDIRDENGHPFVLPDNHSIIMTFVIRPVIHSEVKLAAHHHNR